MNPNEIEVIDYEVVVPEPYFSTLNKLKLTPVKKYV